MRFAAVPCRERACPSRRRQGLQPRHRIQCRCSNAAAKSQKAHVRRVESAAEFGWAGTQQVAQVLTASFYDEVEPWQLASDGGAGGGRWGAALFGWSSVLSLLLQHLLYGRRHVTLLATLDGQVVACCGLTTDLAPPDVAACVGLAAGADYCLLTGLAVAPGQRRRGIASQLLAEAAGAAAARLACPAVVALLVARTNTAAVRLYAQQGFEEQASWVDTRWKEEAERGKVGKPRRLLLAKRVLA